MRTLELLAPAKNLECGKAAIDHGADAVYIGPPAFGARAAAGNSIGDIRRLADYAHLFGAKVYVTVNTIVYDDELEQARQLLTELAEAGADAVLVQDMALLSFSSPIPLYASTQTDNRTAEKVRWLSNQGFSRVVLARELSASEISAIHREVPNAELEVFIHGALCVSYSGLCYASQHCFGRSANRGACAQFCRMKFDLLDADGQMIDEQRHFLSLKDLNQSAHLAELIEAGASSFKIEGRLKDASYVKNVTTAYSQLLNAFIDSHPGEYRRASLGRCTYTFTPDLKKTFNRGYTSYFLNGRQPDIASPDTPKAIGEYVGRVKELRGNSLTVAGLAAFENGDGLCFIDNRRELHGFRVNRCEGNRLFPLQMPLGLHPGMALYRNNDQALERVLSKPSASRKIPVKMTLEACDSPALGFSITISDGHRQASAFIEADHQEARTPQHEHITAELSKLGSTPLVLTQMDFAPTFNFFIPSSRLSELRRAAVQALLRQPLPKVTPAQPEREETTAVEYPADYLYNISNDLARQFYGKKELTAYELRPAAGAMLMQCRYCLRHALGHCTRHGGKQPAWHEPLFLRLGDGRRFRLEFDCKQCQMNVYAT